MFWKLLLIFIGTIYFVGQTEAVTDTTNNDDGDNNANNKASAITNKKPVVDRSTIKTKIRTSSMARYGLIPEHLVDGTIEDPYESQEFVSKRRAKWMEVIIHLARMETTRKLIGLWLSSKSSALKNNKERTQTHEQG